MSKEFDVKRFLKEDIDDESISKSELVAYRGKISFLDLNQINHPYEIMVLKSLFPEKHDYIEEAMNILEQKIYNQLTDYNIFCRAYAPNKLVKRNGINLKLTPKITNLGIDIESSIRGLNPMLIEKTMKNISKYFSLFKNDGDTKIWHFKGDFNDSDEILLIKKTRQNIYCIIDSILKNNESILKSFLELIFNEELIELIKSLKKTVYFFDETYVKELFIYKCVEKHLAKKGIPCVFLEEGLNEDVDERIVEKQKVSFETEERNGYIIILSKNVYDYEDNILKDNFHKILETDFLNLSKKSNFTKIYEIVERYSKPEYFRRYSEEEILEQLKRYILGNCNEMNEKPNVIMSNVINERHYIEDDISGKKFILLPMDVSE